MGPARARASLAASLVLGAASIVGIVLWSPLFVAGLGLSSALFARACPAPASKPS